MPKTTVKSRGYDLDPNSIFGTSKMILKEYQNGLDKEPITPISNDTTQSQGLIQGKINPKAEGIFGEYNLILKNLTNSLNTGTYYLERNGTQTKNIYKSTMDGNGRKKGGFFRPIGYARPSFNTPKQQNIIGGVKTDFSKYKKKAESRFHTKEQANAYFFNKYAKVNSKGQVVSKERGQVVSKDDLQIAGYFGIYSPNRRQTDTSTTLVKYLTNPSNPVQPQPEIPDLPPTNNEVLKLQANVKQSGELDDPEEFEDESVLSDEVGIEGNRFTEHPDSNIGVHSGDPYENPSDSGSIEEMEAGEEFPNYPPHPLNHFDIDDEQTPGFESQPADARRERYDFDIDSTSNYPSDYPDYNSSVSEGVGRPPEPIQQEQYLITLLNNIANQVNKALDYWETEIRPIFTKISKSKVQSFISSKIMSESEKAVEEFEEEVGQQELLNLLPDFVDKITDSIINGLTELFDEMNLDLKKYSSGISNEPSTGKITDPVYPRTLEGGFVQLLRSPYGNLSHFPAKNFL